MTEASVSSSPKAQNARAAGPPRRGRVILTTALTAAVVGGGLWFFNWATVGRYLEKTNNAYLQADQVTVAPRVFGYVTQVAVGDNQAVSAGQVLVRIDPRSSKAASDQSQAAILARRADVTRAKADLDRQAAAIAEARSNLEAANAKARFARADLKRYTNLAAGGADTAQKRDQARATVEQADSEARAKAAALAGAERQITALQAGFEQADAALAGARAQAASTQVDLQAAIIRSPISGKIGDRTVRLGQYVQPGVRLMSVVPVEQIYLVANFKETQIRRMRVGQPVTVRVDALPDLKIEGRVESFAPGTGAQFALLPPQNATGNFTRIVQRVPVRISIRPDPKTLERLLPGLSSQVVVDTKDSARGG